MEIVQQALLSYRRMFLVRGIIAIVFGVLALVVSPGITMTFLVYLFGAYAFISGVVAAATALGHTKEDGWALLLVEGILGMAAGIIAFVWPGITALVLLYLIAAWAAIIGIMQIIGAVTLPLGTGREWLLGLTGFLSIVFGFLISMRPAAGLVTVIWLIGFYAIVYGVMNCVVYFQSRSLATGLS